MPLPSGRGTGFSVEADADPRGPEIPAQFSGAAMKHRPGNAADRSSLHIGRKVVDKKAFFRAQAEALQGKAVNFRLGLHQSFVGRDKSSVKVTAGADPGPVFVLAEAGVGKQVNPAKYLQ